MPEDSYVCVYCDAPWGSNCNCEVTYNVIERYLSEEQVWDPTELTRLVLKAQLEPVLAVMTYQQEQLL